MRDLIGSFVRPPFFLPTFEDDLRMSVVDALTGVANLAGDGVHTSQSIDGVQAVATLSTHTTSTTDRR